MGPNCHHEFPYKREEDITQTHGEKLIWTWEQRLETRNGYSPRFPRGSRILSNFGIPVFRSVKRIHFYCLSHQISCDLLQQSQETNILS